MFLTPVYFMNKAINICLQIFQIFFVKGERATVFRTERGVRLQDLQGHIYQVVETSHTTGRVYWRCQYARRGDLKCKAKVHTTGEWIVNKSGLHNHEILSEI